MASIEDIRAGVARFTAQTTEHVGQLGAVMRAVEQARTSAAEVTSGTGDPRVTEALALIAQAQQALREAGTLAQGTAAATSSYVAGF